jgi:hypothetical protein
MERRYKALRFLGRIYQIIGIIIGILTVVAIIAGCVGIVIGGVGLNRFSREFGSLMPGTMMGGTVAGLVGLVLALLYGGIAALTLYAIGEAIFVLLAMEENTRATANLLRQPASQPASPPPQLEPLEER